jgi:hypothetical protein
MPIIMQHHGFSNDRHVRNGKRLEQLKSNGWKNIYNKGWGESQHNFDVSKKNHS